MKQGNPADRDDVARYVRRERAKWPRYLCCPGTRRSWYAHVIQEAHNMLAGMVRERRAYVGPVLVSDSGLAALEPTPVDVREFDVVQGGAV